MTESLLMFMYGGLFVCCLVAGLVFLGYARARTDRFFSWFALAFWCLAVSWGMRIFDELGADAAPSGYLVRLLGFALIVVAVLERNRRHRNRRHAR